MSQAVTDIERTPELLAGEASPCCLQIVSDEKARSKVHVLLPDGTPLPGVISLDLSVDPNNRTYPGPVLTLKMVKGFQLNVLARNVRLAKMGEELNPDTPLAQHRRGMNEAKAFLRSKQKIHAIKKVRETTGLGLRESKAIVDDWEYRITNGEVI
jgi:hypothetical protein